MTRTAYEKIVARITVDANGCWLWPGANDGKGYGRVRDADGSVVYVHRAMWASVHGPIPAGHHVDHLCRVHNCCNPDHLEAVTPSVNNKRKPHRTHCKWGHEFARHARVRASGRYDCRVCAAEGQRRLRARRREAVAARWGVATAAAHTTKEATDG